MKSRGFQGKFFTDPYVQDLSLSEKFVYIYYLYNERVNWLGTYEVSDKTALFEIGDIKAETLQRIKAKFQNEGKILFAHKFVIIKNSEKYENHLGNKQLMRTALAQFKTLPDEVKSAFLSYKPKEIVEMYSSTFAELGYEVSSNLLSSLPSSLPSSQPVDEEIRNKKEEVRNKKEEITPEDVEKLSQELGISQTAVLAIYKRIKNYELSKGKKYKNYPATIRLWADRKQERGGLTL